MSSVGALWLWANEGGEKATYNAGELWRGERGREREREIEREGEGNMKRNQNQP